MATIKSITKHVYTGSGSYIALITGEAARYGLSREFTPRRDVTSARSNVYRDIEWTLTLEEGQVYEYSFRTSSRASNQGYWLVFDGLLAGISRAQAEGYVKGLPIRS